MTLEHNLPVSLSLSGASARTTLFLSPSAPACTQLSETLLTYWIIDNQGVSQQRVQWIMNMDVKCKSWLGAQQQSTHNMETVWDPWQRFAASEKWVWQVGKKSTYLV